MSRLGTRDDAACLASGRASFGLGFGVPGAGASAEVDGTSRLCIRDSGRSAAATAGALLGSRAALGAGEGE